MAEPMSEQITSAVKTALAAIVGDGGTTFWYSPAHVLKAPDFTMECLDTTLADTATVYVIVPGDETLTRPGAFGRVRLCELPIDLAVVQRFVPSTENPYTPPDPDRRTIQRRLARDAEKALLADTTWGGLALNTDVPVIDMSPENTFIAGWACAFMHVRISYQYVDTAP